MYSHQSMRGNKEVWATWLQNEKEKMSNILPAQSSPQMQMSYSCNELFSQNRFLCNHYFLFWFLRSALKEDCSETRDWKDHLCLPARDHYLHNAQCWCWLSTSSTSTKSHQPNWKTLNIAEKPGSEKTLWTDCHISQVEKPLALQKNLGLRNVMNRMPVVRDKNVSNRGQ